ncbi:unnamed protein product [Rhizoctonia solani]|uniref:Prolyl 4-hydroxylase alpha subunit domain-containing protein n=1 Tax=Rhizoctonia solani TaxID=456999 RepID=A0A8H3HYY8_9AGAM|nr:unnamed protein product [Rhizoctonia solani]
MVRISHEMAPTTRLTSPNFKEEIPIAGPPERDSELARVVAHRLDFVKLGLPEYKNRFAIVVDNLFTPEDCARYGAMVEAEKEWEDAGVGVKTVNTSYRNSSRILFDNEELANEIFEKLKPYLNDINSLDRGVRPPARLIGLNKRFRFLKYGPGQFFRRHCDSAYTTPDGTQTSYYTLQLYLTGSDGGATRFWKMGDVDGVERRKARPGVPLCKFVDVEPRTGRALVFEQRGLVHSGEEVVCGTKLTVRTDLMFEEFLEGVEGTEE